MISRINYKAGIALSQPPGRPSFRWYLSSTVRGTFEAVTGRWYIVCGVSSSPQLGLLGPPWYSMEQWLDIVLRLISFMLRSFVDILIVATLRPSSRKSRLGMRIYLPPCLLQTAAKRVILVTRNLCHLQMHIPEEHLDVFLGRFKVRSGYSDVKNSYCFPEPHLRPDKLAGRSEI